MAIALIHLSIAQNIIKLNNSMKKVTAKVGFLHWIEVYGTEAESLLEYKLIAKVLQDDSFNGWAINGENKARFLCLYLANDIAQEHHLEVVGNIIKEVYNQK